MRRVEIAERPDWRASAEALGFRFHTIAGDTYWDEGAYYASAACCRRTLTSTT